MATCAVVHALYIHTRVCVTACIYVCADRCIGARWYICVWLCMRERSKWCASGRCVCALKNMLHVFCDRILVCVVRYVVVQREREGVCVRGVYGHVVVALS